MAPTIISIEGNIGSGKSTLVENLRQKYEYVAPSKILSSGSDVSECHEKYPWRNPYSHYVKFLLNDSLGGCTVLYSGDGWNVTERTWTPSESEEKFWIELMKGVDSLVIYDFDVFEEHLFIRLDDSIQEIKACHSHQSGMKEIIKNCEGQFLFTIV